MGSQVFPTTLYPRILQDGYDAEQEDVVGIQTARDGTEMRVLHGTAWRCSFRMIVRTASERSTFRTFYNARHGSFDSFYFTSRDDLVSRHVRFDGCVGRCIGPGIWEYRITLRQVEPS